MARDPFWWPMAEPPLRQASWVEKYFPPLTPWQERILYGLGCENPRVDLLYLCPAPPDVQEWLLTFRGGAL